MTREIIEVPFPRASVKPLINCAWGEACERAIASERAVVLGFIEQRRSVSPGQKKERTSRTRERERERERTKRDHIISGLSSQKHIIIIIVVVVEHHQHQQRSSFRKREKTKNEKTSRRRTHLLNLPHLDVLLLVVAHGRHLFCSL